MCSRASLNLDMILIQTTGSVQGWRQQYPNEIGSTAASLHGAGVVKKCFSSSQASLAREPYKQNSPANRKQFCKELLPHHSISRRLKPERASTQPRLRAGALSYGENYH